MIKIYQGKSSFNLFAKKSGLIHKGSLQSRLEMRQFLTFFLHDDLGKTHLSPERGEGPGIYFSESVQYLYQVLFQS